MNRRTAAVVLGALVLVLAVAVAVLASYPFSYDSPHGADPNAERFTVELGDEFHLTGRVATDGSAIVEYEAMRTADGHRYERVETNASVRAVYRAEPDGELYRLYRYPDEAAAESTRDTVELIESRTIVADERVGGDVRLLVVDEDPDEVDGTVLNAEITLLNGLQDFAAFDRVADDGASHVYEPQTGWYRHSDRTGEFRVTDASGEVTVDAGTNAVQSGNVSVRYTTASTYLEDVRGRGETSTVDTVVSVGEAPATIETPEWVREIRAQR